MEKGWGFGVGLLTGGIVVFDRWRGWVPEAVSWRVLATTASLGRWLSRALRRRRLDSLPCCNQGQQ
jgi:hypothetical protein